MISDNIFKIIFDDSTELSSTCNSLKCLVDNEPIMYDGRQYIFKRYGDNGSIHVIGTEELVIGNGRSTEELITFEFVDDTMIITEHHFMGDTQKKIVSTYDHGMTPCPFVNIGSEVISMRNNVDGQYTVKAYVASGRIVQLIMHQFFSGYNGKIINEAVNATLNTVTIGDKTFTCLRDDSGQYYILVDGHQLMPVIDLKKEIKVPQFNEDV